MKIEQQNILFFPRTMKLGGTEKVVLQLCEIMKDKADKIIVCSSGGVNTERLKELGVKHYTIPDIECKSPKVIIDTIRKLRYIIKKENISVIHTHHRMAAFYTRILTMFNKICFINTSHNTFTDKKFFTRFAFKKANLIACGGMVKKNLMDVYGFSDDQVTVVHNGIEEFNETVIEIPELTKLKADGYILVGNIGRLSEQKGMEYFIQSYPEVKKKNGNVKYIIVGDGEDKDKLKQLVKELNADNDVIFLGYRNDIQNVMSQLDFIVLSSLWEGFPLTPIEAFSVKKTVIATAVDGTVEIVDDRKNGFLVESKNPQVIADRIIELCNNPTLKREFEKEAYDKFISELSFTKFSENMENYYKKL